MERLLSFYSHDRRRKNTVSSYLSFLFVVLHSIFIIWFEKKYVFVFAFVVIAFIKRIYISGKKGIQSIQ
ncbi:hypothetical protein J3Q64DRAFT_1727105 [Phycomyces blakesleeanus]|uniref:Uncharacterized protein n=1 Tax=Phycomyces blakesleeanus TaxID=4837 RepID=A0ABR3B836_PHYBL